MAAPATSPSFINCSVFFATLSISIFHVIFNLSPIFRTKKNYICSQPQPEENVK